MAIVLLWDRDRATLRTLLDGRPGPGRADRAGLAGPGPARDIPRRWASGRRHVADRLADRPEVFAGRAAWWAYAPAVLGLTLPWTPFALVGAWRRSAGRWRERGGADRLLWAWAVGPLLLLLSMATVKNAHYAIHALPPWSIWAAMGLARVGDRLRAAGTVAAGDAATAGGRLRRARRWRIGLGFGPARRPGSTAGGVEWAFYEAAGAAARPGRAARPPLRRLGPPPYPTPFGPVPTTWPSGSTTWTAPPPGVEGEGRWPDLPARPFAAIARDRDLDGLPRLGRVEKVAQGPPVRWDRTYSLFRVTPDRRGGIAPRRVRLNQTGAVV